MCVANLCVSTQPCGHRWYQLVRPCQPGNNLQNCPEKLQLEGWESRTSACPWCDGDGTDLHESTHRLFGNPSPSNSAVSSPTATDLGFSMPRRVDSLGTLGSLSPLSRHSSAASTESGRGLRHREMNERLHVYLNAHPHEVLPSAAKNYPTFPQAQARPQAMSQASSQAQSKAVQSQELVPEHQSVSQRSSGAAFTRRWKRVVRSSVDLFRS